MKYNNYAHLELKIISRSKNALGNTANYKNLAKWNQSRHGNVTSLGSNGDPSYYNLYDISGQVYEWTDSSDSEYSELKICRGGCYVDENVDNLSKNHKQKFHYNMMLNDGFFGFRVATIDNIYNYNNFVTINNSNNISDNCINNIGSVNYLYQINQYLVSNEDYCGFLNSIDPSGLNYDHIYDDNMQSSPIGGISLNSCAEIGSKYIIKPNMQNKPATFIKWLMAAKYINWLHNGKSSPINSGAYDLSSSSIVRQSNAEYFLPNENEWYKAAYYDPNKNNNGPGYWLYGTKKDDPPLAVMATSNGDASYPEGYHNSIKTFPIIVNKNFDAFSLLATESSSSVDPCPSIQISGFKPTNSNNYLYFINSTISNLEYNKEYNYNFESLYANWPCKITPKNGRFVAYSENQEINAVLEFCPKNYQNLNICNNNLSFNSLGQENNFFINLELNITANNSCTNTISANHLIETSGLPEIGNKSQNYLNIEFLDSHDNAIIVSGNLCCRPIPIVVSVSGHSPGEEYSYELSSSSNSLQIVPNTGIVSFGNQTGKITAFAIGLNNNVSVLSATVKKVNENIISSDQVLLQCIAPCEFSCENHANYKNMAKWSSCITDCTYPDESLDSNVTTVGTNGGPGPYGTYDMDGNVYELVHINNLKTNPASYRARGGSFKTNTVGKTQFATLGTPHQEVGFRIASYTNKHNYDNMLQVQDIGLPPSGNLADNAGYGKVSYPFMIGKYPVTNCEYVEFLNNTASDVSLAFSNMVYGTGMSGCYGGINRCSLGSIFNYHIQDCMDHKPVRFVSSYGMLKYINWLNNNKPSGWDASLTGTYLLNSNAVISGNRFPCGDYFLPSENEWYKAAYYKGSNSNNTNAGYWEYSTKASLAPEPIIKTSLCGDGLIDGCPEPENNLVCYEPSGICATPTPSPTCSLTITPTVTITPTYTSTPTITPTPSLSLSYNTLTQYSHIIP